MQIGLIIFSKITFHKVRQVGFRITQLDYINCGAEHFLLDFHNIVGNFYTSNSANRQMTPIRDRPWPGGVYCDPYIKVEILLKTGLFTN